MKLHPVIAGGYYGSGGRVRQYLTDGVLNVISDIACSRRTKSEIAPEVLAELVEMHVLKELDSGVRLDTSVFLRDDIERILSTVSPLAKELGRRVLASGAGFREAPPEITVFLGGLGFTQGFEIEVAQKEIGVDWTNYPGRYARTKVDFDEECPLYEAIALDYLNKYVIHGQRYTAVFIGPPEGISFHSFLPMGASQPRMDFVRHLNYFLVDAYAMLVKGEIKNDSLRISAEVAKLYKTGSLRTAIVTEETVRKYQDSIQSIQDAASSFYLECVDMLTELLRSTTAGRQGAPPEKMMLNLWRYIRKLTGKELYDCGFFTDDIPAEGTLTVFFENDVEMLRWLLT